jgi:hypothetical protein
VEGPSGLLAPGTAPNVVVEIKSVIQNFVPGTGQLWYRYDDGLFTSTDLASAGGDLYSGTLPVVDWGDKGEFYFSAQSDQGVVAKLPEYAPVEVFTFEVRGETRTAFSDDFENDKGWTAENLGATSGDWQRGVPIDDPCWVYDPVSDSDGSGQCWLTENLNNPAYTTPWNTDVDNGAVRLTSPGIDLSFGRINISYDYFLLLTEGGQGTDHLLVEIDPNDGNGPWTIIADHTTNGGLDWRHHEIDADTLAGLNVKPSEATRLRFTVNDAATQSIVEAGLDAVLITSTAMTRPGDMDGDNDVDLFDVARFGVFWMRMGCGLCGGADRAGDDGNVGAPDLYALKLNWLKGKGP